MIKITYQSVVIPEFKLGDGDSEAPESEKCNDKVEAYTSTAVPGKRWGGKVQC